MKLVKKIAAGAAIMMMAAALFAIDGKTVVQQALDVKEPDFSMAQVYMDLIEKDGTTERRAIVEYGKSEENSDSMIMMFKSPASVKDTRFLQITHDGADDDKWIYLPALRTTRRIASSQGDKSFMGSDATYDDMSTREIDEDTHELLAEDVTKNGYTCYQVKSTPVNADDAQYKYRISWYDKATHLPVYAEMYDKDGKLLKTLEVEDIQNINGYDTPMKNILTNVQTGHATRLTIVKLVVDKPIPDSVFTQNFLKTGR